MKKPDISPGEWKLNVDTVWRGRHPIVIHPINNKHSIADAKAISQVPEVMEKLEAIYSMADFSVYEPKKQTLALWDIRDIASDLMLAMGYTEDEQEGETFKPESET